MCVCAAIAARGSALAHIICRSRNLLSAKWLKHERWEMYESMNFPAPSRHFSLYFLFFSWSPQLIGYKWLYNQTAFLYAKRKGPFNRWCHDSYNDAPLGHLAPLSRKFFFFWNAHLRKHTTLAKPIWPVGEFVIFKEKYKKKLAKQSWKG